VVAQAVKRRSAEATRQPTETGARWLEVWLLHCLRALHASIMQLLRRPLDSLLIIAVIGVALALPAGCLVVLDNLRRVFTGWSDSHEIIVFLRTDVSDQGGRDLADALQGWTDVNRVRFIDRHTALAEFKQLSGFPEAIEALEENPLPASILLHPAGDADDAYRDLLTRLRALPEVAAARFDRQWALRLEAMMETLRRAAWLLSGLLGLVIILVIGNTVRLAVLNRREEIRVQLLFGAGRAFIARPFLYTGLWYGLGGGLLAWAIIAAMLWALRLPVQELAASYHSSFMLQGPNLQQVLALLGLGPLLGLLGSWLSVQQHLRGNPR